MKQWKQRILDKFSRYGEKGEDTTYVDLYKSEGV